MADRGDPFGDKVPDTPSQEETEHEVKEQLGEGEPGASDYTTGSNAIDQAETGRERL